MSISDDYKVVTTGRIIEGFDPDDVQKKLVSALRLRPEQAERFFDKPRVLKKGVSWASADKLCRQLAKIGVSAEIQNPEPSSSSEFSEPVRALHDEPALEIVQDDATAAPGQGTVACPNCQHVQAKAEQCESCGIWFHKFESRAETSQSIPAPKEIPVAAIEAGDSTVVSSDVASEEGGLSPAGIATAAVAALLGALVWKFIAVTFEYELGVIAWAIGGAVGYAAASVGSRGMLTGVICAALALGSIFAGKYWAYSAFVDEFQEQITESTEYDEEMYDYYLEEMEDARLFVQGSGSDIFVRRFMAERGYAYSDNPADVTNDELADFREYIAPRLRDVAQSQPDFEEWQSDSAEYLGDISPWALMLTDFGILDIVFIFLGIGTAFRIGSQWD